MWARRFGDLNRYDAMIIALLITIYLVIQLGWLLHRIPLHGGDQLDYFSLAGDQQAPRASHRGLRIGLTLPVRALVAVFGYSEVAYYAVPVSAGLLFLTATYLLGALLHSRTAGTLGAAAAAFNAHVLWDASYLLPDLMGAGLFAMALVLIGGSRERAISEWSPALVGAGLLLGWSYLVREYTVLFFPLAVLVAWTAGRARLRPLIQIAAGALLMLAVEVLHGAIVLGSPLARIGAVLRRAPTGGLAADPAAAHPAEQSLVETAMMLPRQLLTRDAGWFLLALAGVLIVGSLVTAARRESTTFRQLLVPLVWMVVVYGLMTFFGWTTTERGNSVLRLHKMRYWYPIFPALTVGGVMALLLVFDSGGLARVTGDRGALWARRGVVVASTIIVALTSHASLTSISHAGSFVANEGGSEFREFRAWLAAEGDSIDWLYADSGHGKSLWYILPVYTRTAFGSAVWSGEVREVNVHSSPSPGGPPGWMVAHRISAAHMAQQDILPTWLQDIPTEWMALMVSDNGALAVFATEPTSTEQVQVSLGEADPGDETGVTWNSEGWALTLAEGETARLSYPVTDAMATDTTLSIELSDDVVGAGSLRVTCGLAGDLQHSAFNVAPPRGDPAASQFFCEGSQPQSIDLVLEGPLRGTIEDLQVRGSPAAS